MSDDYRRKTRNRVLANTNDLVGQARPSCYDLPPTAHAYGRSVAKDPEGAGQVIGSWRPHIPSERPEDKQQDFRKINKTATRNGITNAKQLGEFKQQVDIRVTDPSVAKTSVPSLYNSKFAYGVKSKPSTPIEKLVGGSFAAESQERLKARYRDYSEHADMPNGKYRIKLTKVAASRIADAKMRRHDEEDKTSPRERGQFKLGKFKKVTPRLLQPIAKEDMQPALPVPAPMDSIAKDDMQPAPFVPALAVPPPMDSSQRQFAYSARGPLREQREVDQIIRQHGREMMSQMARKSNRDSSGVAWPSNQGPSEVSWRSNRDVFRSSGAIKEPSDLGLSQINEVRPLEISSAR